jgi:predicted alpha/beta-hydrolase family hydrolase
VEHAVTAAIGLPVVRVDFPYRLAGRRAPDRPPVAIAHLEAEATRLAAEWGCGVEHLVLGGRSFGGRMCSMAVAQGLPAAGLALLSYPLHPPGKPDRLRVEHFPDLRLPVLLVGGDRDPFGSPAEFDAHVPAIPGPVTQHWLPGAHDVRGQDAAVADAVVQWLTALRRPGGSARSG